MQIPIVVALIAGSLCACAFILGGKIEGLRFFTGLAGKHASHGIRAIGIVADLAINMAVSCLAGWYLFQPVSEKQAFIAGFGALIVLEAVLSVIRSTKNRFI